MFDLVHERKRLVQIILLIIIIPFMFWGVESYLRSADTGEVAKVAGEKITQQEFDHALQQQAERMRGLLGADFDSSLLERSDLKNALLDELVTQRLLVVNARQAGLTLSDEQLAQIIAGVPAFQQDGKFDKRTYEAALAAQNLSPAQFEARVRQELAAQQLTAAYSGNGFAPAATVDRLIRLNEQRRVVSVAKLDLAPWLAEAHIADEAVQSYYQSHGDEFQLPERVRVEYVLLSQAELAQRVTVSEQEVANHYAQHQAEFGAPELRHAAHILIAVPRQASSAEKAAARARAEDILREVKQMPAQFAALAKKYSQDPGSAAQGGDLGEFGRGAMVKPFEEAVYRLKPGEISDLVETEFGFHIIKLLAVKPSSVPPLASVRGEIVQRLKNQAAADRFAELSEKFANTVYEQSDSLEPAAALIGGKVQQGPWLSKGQAPQDPWTAKVLQALFSSEAIVEKRNIAAVELDGNRLLAARVVEHRPAAQRPLAEVAAGIRSTLQRQQAMEKLAREAEQLLGRLRAGEVVKLAWQPPKPLSRAMHDELSQAVFKAEVAKLPVYLDVVQADGNHALVRIERVEEVGEIDPAKRARYAQQLRQLTGAELLRAYLAQAREEADIALRRFTPSGTE